MILPSREAVGAARAFPSLAEKRISIIGICYMFQRLSRAGLVMLPEDVGFWVEA